MAYFIVNDTYKLVLIVIYLRGGTMGATPPSTLILIVPYPYITAAAACGLRRVSKYRVLYVLFTSNF